MNVLPEKFEDFDLYISSHDGLKSGRAQVKSCHPDRANSVGLGTKADKWSNGGENDFVVAVWLGLIRKLVPPEYWIAKKRDVGTFVRSFSNWRNRERRFGLQPNSRFIELKPEWKNNWSAFEQFQPPRDQLVS